MKHLYCLLLLAVFLCSAAPAPAIGPFTDNGDTIYDQATGLSWQQQTGDVNGDGSITSGSNPAGDQATWQEALAYCEGLTLAGESDWRLPNIRELKSLADRSTHYPAINETYFQCESSYYWSATTSAGSTANAWGVYFSYGFDGSGNKPDHDYVRCVRGGLSGSFDHLVISRLTPSVTL